MLSPGAGAPRRGHPRPYSRDESDSGIYPPDLVVFPESTAQVSAVFKTCQAHGVPVTPCGARSGKSGGSLPLRGGVALSLERMNRIRSISVEDLTAVVEPGVITGDLMKAVEAKGLFYPPDPNSWEFCTLGGNIAENAGGPRALKYGVTRDYVIGLEWVMPDGEVIRVGRRHHQGRGGLRPGRGCSSAPRARSGVATEITAPADPLPKHVQTALVVFDSVLDRRARGVRGARRGHPAAHARAAGRRGHARGGRPRLQLPAGRRAPRVLAEVDGNVRGGRCSPSWPGWARSATAHGRQGDAGRPGRGASARSSGRRGGCVSTALRALKPHKISEDIAVPRSRIPEIIERLKALGGELGLTVATYGHAGDGNLHANILYDWPHQRPPEGGPGDPSGCSRSTVAAGGTITGEHGVGYAKRDYLSLEQAPGRDRAAAPAQAFFDPAGLLNPGKIFPDPERF